VQHILVAEDDPDLRELATRVLTRAGYTVQAAADGGAALAMAIEHPPRLMILDLRMPVLDGLQLIQALRAEDGFAALPVILHTAYTNEDSRVKVAERLPGVAVVPKGTLPELVEAVAIMLARRSAPGPLLDRAPFNPSRQHGVPT
jgi:two-component system response regulator MprA